MQDMKTTNNPIRDVMSKASAAGYSMADVCRVAEIDQSQASRWLSGRTKPLYASVVRLNQVVDAMVAARLQVLNKAMDEALK
jgi:transcriptional regulator with XRE-family HTH domain